MSWLTAPSAGFILGCTIGSMATAFVLALLIANKQGAADMAATIYRDQEGQRLPSVTTVIGRFKDSGGLVRWAHQRGRDGLDLDARDKATDAGALAREMVIAHLHGRRWQLAMRVKAMLLDKAKVGFIAYLAWERMYRPTIRHIEVPLASAQYRYGGTLDAIGVFAGKLALLDWKASNAVYQDHLIELAAYKRLWDETHPDHPITGGFHLCRFSKENGDFTHRFYPKLDAAWTQFRLFRRAYAIDAQLKKRAAADVPQPPANKRKATNAVTGIPKAISTVRHCVRSGR
jgi:hypothetical protein